MRTNFDFHYKGSLIASKFCQRDECPAHAAKLEKMNGLEAGSVGYSWHLTN